MPAGIAGKAGKRLLKWGQDIMGDSDEVIKKATKPKAKPKPKAKAKPKAKPAPVEEPAPVAVATEGSSLADEIANLIGETDD